jgi:Sec-independent protein secretion pathway component TatC
MMWLASLGAVGSIAFIGMNALAVQDDATFDLTNHRLIVLRIALGALFGVVLTLPFGFKDFLDFVVGLRSPVDAAKIPNGSGVATQSVLLLLPFILGFSTPLVIMILNQFVEAVQSFFGKKTVVVQPSTTKPAIPVSETK